MPVVLISGGTGLIGTNLTRHLIAKNYEVIILTRAKDKVSDKAQVSYAYWNTEKKEIDTDAVKKADYIIHLAGAGVMDKRWSKKFKKQIVESRTGSSEVIVQALKNNPNHVKAFISASAIGWYGEDREPLLRQEGFIETDPPDKDSFLGETCVLWEARVQPLEALGIRLTKVRTGVVLSNDGGAYKEFKMAPEFGIAGILGPGDQVVSWIHIDDICRMYIHLMENDVTTGSYNGVAPTPVTNKKLMLLIANTLKGKFFIPVHVPKFILKILFGEQSIEILKSCTVSAKKIKDSGFRFLFPAIESAVEELSGKKK